MKILMCNSFYYLRGGAERCFFDLSDLLRANGHEVIPFSMHHERNLPTPYSDYFLSKVDYPSLLKKGSTIPEKFYAAQRVIYSSEARQKIERLIADCKPDIAHVHGIAAEISPSILPAIKKAGIPLVQTLHDYRLICPNTNFVSQGTVCERCKRHKYYNVVLRRCKRDSLSGSILAGMELSIHKLFQLYENNVDIFITPSRFLREKLVEYGIKNKIFHLPNFVDVDRFFPEYTPENYFAYYGRLEKIKGVLTLLQAMKLIPDAHLYIAGRGDAEEEIKHFIAKFDLNNVTLVGHLAAEDLIPLIQHAAFTVVPSEWYENYSMSVIESLALGTPVIGSRIGGIPEQIRDGVNGLLFKPGDHEELAQKIRFMLDNRQKVIEMGRNGRKQVESVNSPQQHYQQTIAIYHQLMNSRINLN
jgi:glycosyltransferase involved in cell wall biosynthesis